MALWLALGSTGLALSARSSGGSSSPIRWRHAAPRASFATTTLATTFAPALGAGLANSMFFSGLPEVIEKRREGALGDFNPLPMPIILGNTFGWVAYSLLTQNPFVAAANAPGLLLASWYVMTTIRLAEPSQARSIEKVAMCMAAIHTVAGLTCAFCLSTRQAMISLYGLVCNAILLAYYGAPLSTIRTVLKTRSAASIFFPTVLLNGLNALFWAAYALAIGDVYILVPNTIGLCLAAVQTALCVLMGKFTRPRPTTPPEEALIGVVVPTAAPAAAAVPVVAAEERS